MECQGTVASTGVALGRSRVFVPYTPHAEERAIFPDEVMGELKLLETAINLAQKELSAIVLRLSPATPEKADIFSAHLAILEDEELLEEIRQGITEDSRCAPWAIRHTYREFSALLGAADDPLIRERTADMEDVCLRLLRCAEGAPESTLGTLETPAIVVAEDLFPSDTVLMDPATVLGIITEKGGATSHTAIIARSYGIPALLGVRNAVSLLPTGTQLVLDALEGKVIIAPDDETQKRYAALRSAEQRRCAVSAAYLDSCAITRDGVRIEVDVNIGSVSPTALEAAAHSDGVGLLRSEFLYMQGNKPPDEEAQYRAYRTVLETFGSRPVVLRTLDIGGDKTLPYWELPHEDNPFLGKRALRLCLSEPELFQTQLRAALRASVHGNLWLMFPMVGSLDDLRAAKAAVTEARLTLDRKGIPHNPSLKLGAMIEIPAVALIADLLAKEVDFASIGTNDLTQYLTATDRLNSEVSPYYQSLHPAMLRLIGSTASAFIAEKKDLCVCGELGGDPAAAAVLIGLGLRRLSMSAASLAGIKQLIANITVKEAEVLAQEALALSTAAEIETRLRTFVAEKIGGESIV